MVIVDASQLAALSAEIVAAPARAHSGGADATIDTASRIEDDAKSMAPVRTGELQRSITTEVLAGGLNVEVGATAPYAGFVEFGTSTMAPQPFMAPAADRNVDNYIDDLADVAEDSVFG